VPEPESPPSPLEDVPSPWHARLNRIVQVGMDEKAVRANIASLWDREWACVDFSESSGGYRESLYPLDSVWLLAVRYRAGKVEAFGVQQGRGWGDFAELSTEIGADLFPYVYLVQQSPSVGSGRFDPARLILAVNELHALGKDKALDVLAAYDRLVQRDSRRSLKYDLNENRIEPILELLFVHPDRVRVTPAVCLVRSLNPEWDVEDLSDDCLSELTLTDDVPFVISTPGGRTTGRPGNYMARRIAHGRDHYQLRKNPLSPSLFPLAAAQKLERSDVWRVLFRAGGYNCRFERHARKELREQATRAATVIAQGR